MPRPEWLNVKKQGVKKEKVLMKLAELSECLDTKMLPYKSNFELLHIRDKALVSLLLEAV